MSGHNVSHSEIKTHRRFLPNLQATSFLSEILGTSISMRVSSRGIKTVERHGGLDAYLLDTGNSKLSPEARKLKARILKARDKKSGALAKKN
jgi:large subunit ribosomal protein L28